MALLTPGTIYRESVGSLTLDIVNITLTTGSGSDTWVIPANSPVVAYWGQNNNGTAGTDPDIQWTASTGTFTFTNGSSVGSILLFILMRT